jgi:exodeoxyribonuclease-3
MSSTISASPSKTPRTDLNGASIDMKLVSWNVNGLRACAGKGFAEAFKSLDADCFCLQETKMQEGQLDLQFDGYESFWNFAEKKGYSGTAIFTRVAPLSVAYGIGVDEHDHEGRTVTLEFKDFYLVCVYTPNSQDGLRRLDYRMRWEDDFQAYLHKLNSSGVGSFAERLSPEATMGPKGVVVCGDMNVAHEEIDIKNPDTNHHNAGFTDEERQKMTDLLASGFTDTWRSLNPDTVKYSWWSYRFHGREKNIGWRLDYFLVSNDLKAKVTGAEIHNEIYGSDHCPVELDLDAS